MSRAFVKESETPEPRCPTPQGCGTLGVAVSAATLAANLTQGPIPSFHGEVFYCSNPDCEVAYFDAYGSRAMRDQLRVATWPKDPDGPVCACFGVKADAIEDWAASGDKSELKALLARIERGEGRCATLAPDGKCCATEVRRVFLRALGRETP
jgi:hypothetical protein